MRVSKLPEERKQEIMDIAMHVFAQKGYEQTTIRDIAEAVGVVPGLCYRYFASKESLFEEALQNYAAECCKPLITLLQNENIKPDDLLCADILFQSVRNGSGDYQTFFHKKENENFHVLLSHKICQHMLPYITEYMEKCTVRYGWKVTDVKSYASFYLFGSTPILNDETLSEAEKAARIQEITYRLLATISSEQDMNNVGKEEL